MEREPVFTYTEADPPPGDADTYEVPPEEEPEAEDETPAGEDEPDEPVQFDPLTPEDEAWVHMASPKVED